MNLDLLALLQRYEPHIVALEAWVADLEAQLAARDAHIGALTADLVAAQRAAHRQGIPFARHARKPDPQQPGRKKGQGRFASRAKPAPAQVTATRTALLADCPACGGPVQDRTAQEQVQIELPLSQPTVTRFVTARGYCPACAAAMHGVHPEQISTATGAIGDVRGPRLKALAATLIRCFGQAGWRPFRLAPASG